MTPHQALLLAQDWVKAPRKDTLGDWYIAVYDGKIWKHHYFRSDSSAWAYFYKSIADIKQQFMTQERGGK